MEAWFVARVVSVLHSRCSPLGLRCIQVDGSSERGWTVSAELGDGRPVSTELEMNDVLSISAGEDWVDRVLALFALRLEAAADLVLHPPEPSADGPIMGLDSVGVQLGAEILDKLGESGLERVRGVLTGEEVHDPVGPVREFVPGSGPERKP
jgi:hypothetical protein